MHAGVSDTQRMGDAHIVLRKYFTYALIVRNVLVVGARQESVLIRHLGDGSPVNRPISGCCRFLKKKKKQQHKKQ